MIPLNLFVVEGPPAIEGWSLREDAFRCYSYGDIVFDIPTGSQGILLRELYLARARLRDKFEDLVV